ncbi:protein O-mannosyl-transferase TMTC1-like, partial [Penaeus japonicus]|uniref:protein O-mannosyl-transferase TMTC1-like n=1 Tax=Penaeus japonicus TaxID=27405 RepID=UPI001C7103E3
LWWLYPSAHNNLGTILMQQGKHQEAEWHFSVALQSHPEHSPAARNLASLWAQQGRTDQAISLLESIFAPEDERAEEAGGLLASLYLQQGKVKQAEGVFLSLSAAQPSHPGILADYAALLHGLGRTEATARHYEAALSLDPAHTRALKAYAALMSARDHHARAHELYTRALDREWDPDTATALAKVCILTGRLDQAHALLDHVTLLHPKHLAARVHLAQVKLQQREYTSSEEMLQEVLTEAPSHREALYHLSLVYSVTNRSDEAVGAATVAARACSDPRELCALLHAHHADLLHTLSHMEAAAMSYQLAVSLEPSLLRLISNLRPFTTRRVATIKHWTTTRRRWRRTPPTPSSLKTWRNYTGS